MKASECSKIFSFSIAGISGVDARCSAAAVFESFETDRCDCHTVGNYWLYWPTESQRAACQHSRSHLSVISDWARTCMVWTCFAFCGVGYSDETSRIMKLLYSWRNYLYSSLVGSLRNVQGAVRLSFCLQRSLQIDDCRRTHNYDQFITTFLSMLAEQGQLASLVEQHMVTKRRQGLGVGRLHKKMRKTVEKKKRIRHKRWMKWPDDLSSTLTVTRRRACVVHWTDNRCRWMERTILWTSFCELLHLILLWASN